MIYGPKPDDEEYGVDTQLSVWNLLAILKPSVTTKVIMVQICRDPKKRAAQQGVMDIAMGIDSPAGKTGSQCK